MNSHEKEDNVVFDLWTVRFICRTEDIRQGVNYDRHQRDHKVADINYDRQGLAKMTSGAVVEAERETTYCNVSVVG